MFSTTLTTEAEQHNDYDFDDKDDFHDDHDDYDDDCIPRNRQIETYVFSHADDSSRAAAAGCLGCLVQWLPAEEQVHIFCIFCCCSFSFFSLLFLVRTGFDQLSWQGPVIADTLLQDDPTLDWAVRHGRYFIQSFSDPSLIETKITHFLRKIR